MPKQEKVDSVARISEQAARASALYFLDFTRVPANDFNALRRKLGESGATVRVVKNRLALLALTASGTPREVEQVLKGPTSVVFASNDPVVPARTLREVARKLPALKVKGAFVDRRLYPADQFDFLASLPTVPELRGQLVGALQGPMAELVFSLEGLIVELVRSLEFVAGQPRAAEPSLPGDAAPVAG
jgi:large subunit ribosomal protein L10